MKLVESWLRDWSDPAISSEELAEQLTMSGHEVDAVETQGPGLEKVVVGEVLAVERHPNADKLQLCRVSDGEQTVEVVCGAPNVVAGMKSPLALPGTRLPNGLRLRRSKIRGVESQGMLCSAVELGLGDESDGIMSLGNDAPTGQPIGEYLGLPDSVFELDLTPNRGDCFSVLGLARDVAAITGAPLREPSVEPVTATLDDVYPVRLEDPERCPRFAGRVIRGIDPDTRSPLWLTERLRRAGLRAIYPVVDVTNYVMLELGQPLHAYDLDALTGTVRPRLAVDGESLTLLDARELSLNSDTLVIADDSGSIGLAGIMGGLSTAVNERTSNIFLEAAHFTREGIAGRARQYGMHTDASVRFERGVDPHGPGRAIELATRLLIDIAGGECGPLHVESSERHLPANFPVKLRRSRLEKVLGATIADDVVQRILDDLGLEVQATEDGWIAMPPSHRFDLEIEEDLIEEVARIHGYEHVPEVTAKAEMTIGDVTEARVGLDDVASILVARGYQEIVTYSFVDANLNRNFTGQESELVLRNPISSEMSTMRGSLWPGMVQAAAANVARQQDRVRFFEIGKSFHGSREQPLEVVRVAALALGPVVPEQWGVPAQDTELFDIKSDVVAILQTTGADTRFEFVVDEHPALQPGQVARITRDGTTIGVAGKLHPRIASSFGLKKAVMLIELEAELAFAASVPEAEQVSRYPAIRRDIAVVVDEGVPVAELANVAASAAPELIRQVTIFDVYQGKGIEPGLKSIALGLILQETSRTLTDEDADSATDAAVRKLQREFGADLRE